MVKTLRFFSIIICFLFLTFIFFIPTKQKDLTLNKGEVESIIKIWQIDTFEGGVGSRAQFLRSVSDGFSKQHPKVLSIVTLHTVESAKKELKKGNVPDVVSLGSCGLDLSNVIKEIENVSVFASETLNKKVYFVPWAMGGYFLIKKQSSSQEEVIFSENTYNSSLLAYAISGEKLSAYKVLTSQEAYNEFLINKKACLIGTQRDVVRLTNREVSFTATPIGEFNDLIQYVALTSKTKVNAYYGSLFIKYLLSDKVQYTLTKIKMLSPIVKGLYDENEYFKSLENQSIKYTVSPFTSYDDIQKLKALAEDLIKDKVMGSEVKNLLKHL